MKAWFRKYRLKTILIYGAILFALAGGVLALYLSNNIYTLKILAYLGSSDSQNRLGALYSRQGDDKESAKWYLKASKANLHAKIVTMAIAFSNNGEYPVDCAEARKLAIEAANEESSIAQETLASAYFTGACQTSKNYSQALYWAQKIIDNHHAYKSTISKASLILATLYGDGLGIAKDPVKAHEFLLLQSKQGFYIDAATLFLAEDYARGRGTQVDNKKAMMYYQQSAEHGNSLSQAILSDAYVKGIGVIQNYELAYMWAVLARSGNDSEAFRIAGDTIKWLTIFAMSHEQIQKAQEMAAKWKPLPNESNNLS